MSTEPWGGHRLPKPLRQWEAKLVEVYLGRRDYWDAFREWIAGFQLADDAAQQVCDFARRRPPKSSNGRSSTAWRKLWRN